MSKISAWLKSNLIVLLASAFTLLALGIIAYVIYAGGAFITGQQNLIQTDSSTIDSLLNHQVDIPSPKNLVALEHRQATVNQALIDQIRGVYDGYAQQYRDLSNLINARNRASHVEMDTGLFPDTTLSDKRFAAQGEMRRGLEAMLVDPSDSSSGPAYRLRAAIPPTTEELDADIRAKQAQYLQPLMPRVRSLAELSPEQLKELNEEKTRELFNRLVDRAKSIQVYAETHAPAEVGPTRGAPMRGASAGAEETITYPFELPIWLVAQSPPQMPDIWEGQMQLWITQDIITAIGLANQAYSLETTGDGNERIIPSENPPSVVDAPVKQLLSVHVIPGYVGIQMSSAGEVGPQGFGGARPSRARAGAGGGYGFTPKPSAAVSGDDFSLSPTGRHSIRGPGALYDVKHATVSVIVDAKRLPEFFDAIAQVNFMTVLKFQVTDVDSYDQLRRGFYYGPHACVRVDLLLETLWFRQWTRPLMPARVCQDLGLPTRTAIATP